MTILDIYPAFVSNSFIVNLIAFEMSCIVSGCMGISKNFLMLVVDLDGNPAIWGQFH